MWIGSRSIWRALRARTPQSRIRLVMLLSLPLEWSCPILPIFWRKSFSTYSTKKRCQIVFPLSSFFTFPCFVFFLSHTIELPRRKSETLSRWDKENFCLSWPIWNKFLSFSLHWVNTFSQKLKWETTEVSKALRHDDLVEGKEGVLDNESTHLRSERCLAWGEIE